MAQADVDKASAALKETRDVYVPALIGDFGEGKSWGPPLGQPAVFSIQSQSLLFSYSQRNYIRAAQAGYDAAIFSLEETRQTVAEDVALTYLSLNDAQARKAALGQEYGFATKLVSIVQQRLDAGMDTDMELLQSRRTVAQIRLQELSLDDEISSYADHLARLTGVGDTKLTTVPESIPAFPSLAPATASSDTAATVSDSRGVAAAFSLAKSKMEQAQGDSRFQWRPQVALAMEYSRFSNLFNNYSTYYPAFANNTLNAESIGVLIQMSFYDRARRDRAHETMADAVHAQQNAINLRDQQLEGRLKLQHAVRELDARRELATIDRDISQAQLEAILVQVQTPTTGANPMTPKDSVNAQIQERQKYIDYLSAEFQLRQTEINLLKQTGQLESWIGSLSRNQVGSQPQAPTPPQ
jgi:outer membrane protein TolC